MLRRRVSEQWLRWWRSRRALHHLALRCLLLLLLLLLVELELELLLLLLREGLLLRVGWWRWPAAACSSRMRHGTRELGRERDARARGAASE